MGIMSIRRYTKRLLAPVIIVMVVALTIGMFYIGFPKMSKDSTMSYQGPSIKVNGKTLSDSEFDSYIVRAAQQASQYAQYVTYPESQIRDNAVTMAVNDMAFQQEMEKVSSKINVSGGDIDKLIKKYLPTEEELQNFMERQGFTDKGEFRKAVAKDLRQQKFFQYKGRQLKIRISKPEIIGMLQQITVSHILVGLKDSSNKPRSAAEALRIANEVYQKANTGGNFAQLAKEYSDDPGSKDKGGTYGPMPLEQFKTGMAKEFVSGALALKDGQISKPVKTQFGYHIIRLDSLTTPSGAEYKEKYRDIENSLLVKKTQESPVFQEWTQNIYRKAANNLEILDPGLRAYRLKQQQKWDEAALAYQKAMDKAYYKRHWDIFLDAADVYMNLKQPKTAIAVLKRVPTEAKENVDYQIALAKVYQADNQSQKAQDILVKFGQAHASDTKLHEKLKEVFTAWKLPNLVANEERTISGIQKQEQDALNKYQENLGQKTTTDQQPGKQDNQGNTGNTSPDASPSK